MQPKICCPECKIKLKKIDKIRKKTGYQLSEQTVGYYTLYQCNCGYKWWEYQPN